MNKFYFTGGKFPPWPTYFSKTLVPSRSNIAQKSTGSLLSKLSLDADSRFDKCVLYQFMLPVIKINNTSTMVHPMQLIGTWHYMTSHLMQLIGYLNPMTSSQSYTIGGFEVDGVSIQSDLFQDNPPLRTQFL